MATIEARQKDGKTVYRVKIRRKGTPTQSTTFSRLTDVRKWAQITEAAIDEGQGHDTADLQDAKALLDALA